jgi:8-oxo-dGTP pyrophosphatase MutT (NUDIX family)
MTRKARPAARLLMVDPDHNVLMFRFDAPDRPPFWATPGGACDPGETHIDAARREMEEETGWNLDPGPEIAQRTVEFTTLEGEDIWSDERYFLVRLPEQRIVTEGHTELERAVMTVHKWWRLDELRQTSEMIFPETIADMVETALGERT